MKFNVIEVTQKIIDFIRDYYAKYNLKGAVIGISGGKDSAVVAALFTKALGSENVVGLWLPCHSRDEDKKDAYLLSQELGFKLHEFDLTKLYDSYVEQIKAQNDVKDEDLIDANINIKPRLRMTTLYYYASMLSKINQGGYLVCGTSNNAETFVGYFTKGGDNVCDIQVIKELFVDEIIEIGDYLQIPYHICHKTPDDGLSGLSDEEKLGFSYADVKKVALEIENGIIDNTVNKETKEKILAKHRDNFHKYHIPTYRR